MPPEALDRLEAITRNLDAYLERRAAEIAEPIIKAAEAAVPAEVHDAEAKVQRLEDLIAEIRRHWQACENQLDDLRTKYGERRDPHVVERRGEHGAGHSATEGTRIAVNASQGTVDALKLVVDREGVTLTEAHRRLIEYGALVYREIRVEEHQVVLRGGGCDREVLLA